MSRALPALPILRPRPLIGLALSAFSYALFSVQDACVKALVAYYPVPQILLVRSLVIVGIASVLAWRAGQSSVLANPNKAGLVLRSCCLLMAWLAFYSSASSLPLGQLTTLYFAAPVIIVVLAIFILKEKVAAFQWFCVLVGFAGTVIAADPGGTPDLWPAAKVLFAAFLWALGTVWARTLRRSETSYNLMLVNSGLFTLVGLAMVPWNWTPPDGFALGLMVLTGLVGAAGQFMQFESYRHAPASTLATMEYTALIWAFGFGYGIWGEVPAWQVVAGAGLIVLASLMLVWREQQRVE